MTHETTQPTEVDRKVGRRMRICREITGLTVKQAAWLIERKPDELAAWEAGEARIPARIVHEVAQHYGFHVGSFMPGADEPRPL